MTFATWIRSLFAWRTVHNTGVYIYLENAVTGDRRARRIAYSGHQPLNTGWLKGGLWTDRGSPPSGGSGVRR